MRPGSLRELSQRDQSSRVAWAFDSPMRASARARTTVDLPAPLSPRRTCHPARFVSPLRSSSSRRIDRCSRSSAVERASACLRTRQRTPACGRTTTVPHGSITLTGVSPACSMNDDRKSAGPRIVRRRRDAVHRRNPFLSPRNRGPRRARRDSPPQDPAVPRRRPGPTQPPFAQRRWTLHGTHSLSSRTVVLTTSFPHRSRSSPRGLTRIVADQISNGDTRFQPSARHRSASAGTPASISTGPSAGRRRRGARIRHRVECRRLNPSKMLS